MSPLRVLFIGNSYTFYNEMPNQVAGLAESDPGAPSISTARVTQGGATLKLHYEETGARARIEEGDFTHVVLQEKSTGTLHDADDFHTYIAQLGALAKSRGAELVLYQTWAREPGHDIYRWGWSGRDPDEMLRRVAAQYALAAEALGAEIAPVGAAWAECRRKHPALDLYDVDQHHASPHGSHLAAAVFYATLTGRDPTPLPYRAVDVPLDDALALRAVAWDVARPSSAG